jgi:FkbM family methyltransferase
VFPLEGKSLQTSSALRGFSFFARRAVTRALEGARAHRMLVKWRAWESLHFGEPEIQLLRYLVDPMRNAIDIGAAEGAYSFYLQQLAKHCIAFEPNPRSYANLKRALPAVEVHQAAVSSMETEVTLRVPVVNGIPYTGWGTIEPKNQLAELGKHTLQEIKVRTVCLDRMSLGDVGFVKIDVEGHELDVLAGLSDLLVKCLPNLLIEVGDGQRGGSLSEVRRRLAPLGYIALRLDERRVLVALPNDVKINGSMNVIFIAERSASSTHESAVTKCC